MAKVSACTPYPPFDLEGQLIGFLSLRTRSTSDERVDGSVARSFQKMSDESVSRVDDLSRSFPKILAKAIYFKKNFIPESAWPRLW